MVYIKHILECIDHIKDYTENGKDSFINESLVQDGVLRCLQTMTESTQRLSEDLKASVTDVDWRALSGFRNILVHDYLGGIDLEQVWDAIALRITVRTFMNSQTLSLLTVPCCLFPVPLRVALYY